MTPDLAAATGRFARALQVAAAIVAGGTILLFAGFLADAFVPRTIDGAPCAERGDTVAERGDTEADRGDTGAIAIDLALVALFAAQHSLMARRSFKRWSARFVPAVLERSVYLLGASAALLVVIAAWRPIPRTIWNSPPFASRAAAYGLFALGWIVLAAATAAIDPRALAGLDRARQVGAAGAPAPLRVVGLHRFVRHPTYVGWLLVFWAAPTMSAGRLLFASLMTAYVLAAIPLEERDLVRAHGAAYERYRRAVPALLPWKALAFERVPPRA